MCFFILCLFVCFNYFNLLKHVTVPSFDKLSCHNVKLCLCFLFYHFCPLWRQKWSLPRAKRVPDACRAEARERACVERCVMTWWSMFMSFCMYSEFLTVFRPLSRHNWPLLCSNRVLGLTWLFPPSMSYHVIWSRDKERLYRFVRQLFARLNVTTSRYHVVTEC